MAENHGKSMTVRKHHEKSKLCYTRPSYREARWERAVKVYTVNLESRYLVVSGVASIGVNQELIDKFSSFGNILEYRKLDDYPKEDFTEVYLIKYEKIINARFAKRKMDNKSFFGGILHVFYAPEFESVEECRYKLEERRRTIARKTQGSFTLQQQDDSSSTTSSVPVKTTIQKTTQEQNIPTETYSESTTVSTSTTSMSTAHSTATSISSQNTGNDQDNYLWNFPPLPPPPYETHPVARGTSTGQFLPSNFHSAPRGTATGQFATSINFNSAPRGTATGQSSNFHPAARGTSAGHFPPVNLNQTFQESPVSRGQSLTSTFHATSRGALASVNSHPATRGISPRYFHHIPRGNFAPRGMATEQFLPCSFHSNPRGNSTLQGTFAGRQPLQLGRQKFPQNTQGHGQQTSSFPGRVDSQLQNTNLKRHSDTETTSNSQTQGQNTANKKQRKRI